MESLNQALIECVKHAGGSASVGPKLFPEKTREAAQRLLLDCLSEDRPAKLSPEQVLFILRLARERGYHGGIDYVLETLSYSPTTPIAPADAADELMRQVVEGQRQVIESQRLLAEQLAKLATLRPVEEALAAERAKVWVLTDAINGRTA